MTLGCPCDVKAHPAVCPSVTLYQHLQPLSGVNEVQQVCWSSLQNLSSKLGFREYHLREIQNLLKSVNDEFLHMLSVIIE